MEWHTKQPVLTNQAPGPVFIRSSASFSRRSAGRSAARRREGGGDRRLAPGEDQHGQGLRLFRREVQNRALHAWRELHRLVLMEDLRQGRHRHVGDAADRLSAHAAGSAEPRTPRLRPWRQLLLVSVLGQPRETPDGARAPAQAVARGARDAFAVAAWASIVESPEKRASYTSKRGLGGLVRAGMGRGQRDHRRRQRLHSQEIWPRPRDRLLADPGDVDGVVRRRCALPVAARRRLPVVLRLVLRPAAGQPDDLGRADGRSGKC